MTAESYEEVWEGEVPDKEGRGEGGLDRREALALAKLRKRLAATEAAHWEGVRRRVDERVLGGGQPTVAALRRMLTHLQRRAHAHAKDRLDVEMSGMAERHRARWAGLLVPRGEALVEVASNGYVRRMPGAIDIQGEGIVPLVARTREAYCAATVQGDHHFRRINPETRSEQAVPIVFEGRLLGVLNQESQVEGRFSPATTKALEQEAIALVPHLLAGAAEDDESAACLWNPDLHGWNAGTLLEGMLTRVRSSLGPAAGAMHLTLWYADPADRVLFALASTGYGGSFSHARVLPMDGSFAGRCAGMRRREVADCLAGETMLVRGREVDQDMGLIRVRAVAIRPCQAGEAPTPGLVLSFYVFDAEAEAALPGPGELGCLAALLEPHVDRYLELRPALAASAVDRALRRGLASDDELIDAAETIKEIMGGDEVTVFGSPRPSPVEAAAGALRLRVAASTAPLGSSPDADPEILQVRGGTGRETEYRPGDGTVTGSLAAHPGSIRRLNRPPSHKRPTDARQVGDHRLYEKLPRVASKFRRCLAYSVRGRSANLALGVIRVVRSSEGRPFTSSDAATLARAAQACEDALRSWRDRIDASTLMGEAGAGRRRLRMPPPRPVARPARAIAREVLEEVHGVVREQLGDCVLQVSALVEAADASDRPIRVFEYYSALVPVSAFDGFSPTLPPRFDPSDLRLRDRSWGEFLDARLAVTFMDPDSDDAETRIRAGARVPFQFWCGRHAQRGALIVDLTRPKSLRAVVDDLNLAAQKLAVVLTRAGCEAVRTGSPAPDPDAFVRDVRERLGASSVALASEPHPESLALWAAGAEVPREWFVPGSDAPWEMPTVRHADGEVSRDLDAARWGVSELRVGSHRYLRIPVRQASGIAAVMIIGWEGADEPDRDSLRSIRIRDALALAGSWIWRLAADEASDFTPTTGQAEGDSVVWSLGMIDLARLSRRDSSCVLA